MHILQPKHSKINEEESEELLSTLNISKAQLPKILSTDPALPEGCIMGDIIKIERNNKANIPGSEGEKTPIYYRVVV